MLEWYQGIVNNAMYCYYCYYILIIEGWCVNGMVDQFSKNDGWLNCSHKSSMSEQRRSLIDGQTINLNVHVYHK